MGVCSEDLRIIYDILALSSAIKSVFLTDMTFNSTGVEFWELEYGTCIRHWTHVP